MKRCLYVLWQCSWGALQTLMGLVVFLMHLDCPHFWYHGAVVTRWSSSSSVSLGLFLFVADDVSSLAKDCTTDAQRKDFADRLLVHEYGHTIQSLLLGPLYLLVIGIPSSYWGNSRRCIERRRYEQLPYCAFFTERWANLLGEAVTKAPSLRDARIG